MGAYTLTQAAGVDRMLCLGSKKLDETIRITGDNTTTTVGIMEFVATGNKNRTQEKINTDIIPNMTATGTGKNLETAKKETAVFFNADGKLQKPTGTEWTGKTITFSPTTIE